MVDSEKPEISIVGAGAVLSSLLTEKGITNAELASRIGVDRSLVGRYIKNERALTLSTIYKIAETLDVPAEQLVISCLQVAYPQLLKTKVGANLKRIVSGLAVLQDE